MKQTKIKNGMMVSALFAVYVYALLKVILFKFHSIEMTYLWHQAQSLSSHDLINLVGNIAIFMPYGIFLVLLSKNQSMSFLGVLARSLGLSLMLGMRASRVYYRCI